MSDTDGEPMSETGFAPSSRAEINAIIEAVQLTAASMSAMADRIRELELHVQAFELSNQELEANNIQLAAEVKDVIEQRDTFASNREAEGSRAQQLELLAASNVDRAENLERDLDGVHTALARIIEVVAGALGAPPKI